MIQYTLIHETFKWRVDPDVGTSPLLTSVSGSRYYLKKKKILVYSSSFSLYPDLVFSFIFDSPRPFHLFCLWLMISYRRTVGGLVLILSEGPECKRCICESVTRFNYPGTDDVFSLGDRFGSSLTAVSASQSLITRGEGSKYTNWDWKGSTRWQEGRFFPESCDP